MARRHLAEQLQRGDAHTLPQLTRDYLQAQLRDRQREVFALLLLDNQQRVIQFVELFFWHNRFGKRLAKRNRADRAQT